MPPQVFYGEINILQFVLNGAHLRTGEIGVAKKCAGTETFQMVCMACPKASPIRLCAEHLARDGVEFSGSALEWITLGKSLGKLHPQSGSVRQPEAAIFQGGRFDP